MKRKARERGSPNQGRFLKVERASGEGELISDEECGQQALDLIKYTFFYYALKFLQFRSFGSLE